VIVKPKILAGDRLLPESTRAF